MANSRRSRRGTHRHADQDADSLAAKLHTGRRGQVVLRVLRQGVEGCSKHPLAAGAISLLGLASIAFSVFVYVEDRFDSTTASKQLASITSRVAEIDAKLPVHTGLVQVGHVWDLTSARSIAVARLGDFGSRFVFLGEQYADKTIEHQFVGQYLLALEAGDSYVLVYSSAPASGSYNCRACPVKLSVFEYARRDDGRWWLVAEAISAVETGEWGRVPEEGIKVIQIGADRFAISVTASYSNWNSWSGKHVTLFAHIGDSYHEVFERMIESDAPANLEQRQLRSAFRADLEFLVIPQRKFYDLVLDVTETEYEERRVTHPEQLGGFKAVVSHRSGCRRQFEFDGQRYVLRPSKKDVDDREPQDLLADDRTESPCAT
jgi:hypothetical protein